MKVRRESNIIASNLQPDNDQAMVVIVADGLRQLKHNIMLPTLAGSSQKQRMQICVTLSTPTCNRGTNSKSQKTRLFKAHATEN